MLFLFKFYLDTEFFIFKVVLNVLQLEDGTQYFAVQLLLGLNGFVGPPR